jgi:hypothetical protein
MHKFFKLLIVAGLLLLTGFAYAQDKNFHVFLCFGQSNMGGFPGIPEEEKAFADPRFQVLAVVDFPELKREKNHWYTATPPLCDPKSGLCPADYFGRTLLAALPADQKVGVIVVSVGGCKIELFDERTREAYVATAPVWMKPMIASYDGDPYRRLVELGRIAQRTGVIRGILLHQGESNPNDSEWAARVEFIYESLLTDLGLKAEDVPLLAGEVVSGDQNGAAAGKNAAIAELPKIIPTAYVVSSVGCPCMPDHLHFTPEGYRELGKRYAATMLPLLRLKAAKTK